jgi:hypothetical protein
VAESVVCYRQDLRDVLSRVKMLLLEAILAEGAVLGRKGTPMGKLAQGRSMRQKINSV